MLNNRALLWISKAVYEPLNLCSKGNIISWLKSKKLKVVLLPCLTIVMHASRFSMGVFFSNLVFYSNNFLEPFIGGLLRVCDTVNFGSFTACQKFEMAISVMFDVNWTPKILFAPSINIGVRWLKIKPQKVLLVRGLLYLIATVIVHRNARKPSIEIYSNMQQREFWCNKWHKY